MLILENQVKITFNQYNKENTYVCVSGGKKFSFFRKALFLETPALRFALLPYYRRFNPCVQVWLDSQSIRISPHSQNQSSFQF